MSVKIMYCPSEFFAASVSLPLAITLFRREVADKFICVFGESSFEGGRVDGWGGMCGAVAGAVRWRRGRWGGGGEMMECARSRRPVGDFGLVGKSGDGEDGRREGRGEGRETTTLLACMFVVLRVFVAPPRASFFKIVLPSTYFFYSIRRADAVRERV